MPKAEVLTDDVRVPSKTQSALFGAKNTTYLDSNILFWDMATHEYVISTRATLSLC